jgi:hypothetical protein
LRRNKAWDGGNGHELFSFMSGGVFHPDKSKTDLGIVGQMKRLKLCSKVSLVYWIQENGNIRKLIGYWVRNWTSHTSFSVQFFSIEDNNEVQQ